MVSLARNHVCNGRQNDGEAVELNVRHVEAAAATAILIGHEIARIGDRIDVRNGCRWRAARQNGNVVSIEHEAAGNPR
ncbi:MAG: hypothetical protein AAB263_04745, partial [Planctomycetota bacterium]